ncbi:MAG: 2,5-diamino-6-(ribosylamino)-4(3H)-pyrimidinone 5'-phosphate reductase [Bathelium mastoideum]|nr:MAG: 2,5-diamino-6-(ribosylamino)-4(3H)-pyrimidinone 5'-phosphate reductase [Bathelium mastoideum]
MSNSTLVFSSSDRAALEPYLPPRTRRNNGSLPFATLTFATSLDAAIALSPGTQTILSGPESKAMTHFLRSRHEAILVGVGTAMADDPGLSCRLEGVALEWQPRPIIIDPVVRWDVATSRCLSLARQGKGKAPYIMCVQSNPPLSQRKALEAAGGKYIYMDFENAITEEGFRFSWTSMLVALWNEGLHSVMVEGGGSIINSLLVPPDAELISSVILTIAPTWLGRGGVIVSPERKEKQKQLRLQRTKWHQLGEDVILCGTLRANFSDARQAKLTMPMPAIEGTDSGSNSTDSNLDGYAVIGRPTP